MLKTLSFFIYCLQLSDWDRYAAEEYELLVAEEGASDQQDEV
jgi:serine/threonine-protein phosphatase 2A regulatory subunit B''